MPELSSFQIAGREIGAGAPVFVIAEMSANHHQEIDRAYRIIDAAAQAGADAVKLQTYRPDTITIDCDRDYFRIGDGSRWSGRTLHELYESAYTPWAWHAPLKEYVEDRGLVFLSTPFDTTAVDLLSDLDVPAYKVASFEIVDIPLIAEMARRDKPMIMSTGMARLDEIDRAVRAVRSAGNDRLVLLKCTSAYPAPADEANLATIPHLADSFGVPTGLSDHTLGVGVPAAAVALGASVVEKHLTLSRDDEGPDSAFSLEPKEFERMVDAVRRAEASVGDVQYGVTKRQEGSRQLRRSLFVVRDVAAGDEFTEENIRSIRPGDGLSPRMLPEILGRRARRDIERGTPMGWDLVG